jgi:hypothetical protein
MFGALVAFAIEACETGPLPDAGGEELCEARRLLFFSSFFFSLKISKILFFSYTPNFGTVSKESGSFQTIFFFDLRGGRNVLSIWIVKMGTSTPSRMMSTSHVGMVASKTGRGSDR